MCKLNSMGSAKWSDRQVYETGCKTFQSSLEAMNFKKTHEYEVLKLGSDYVRLNVKPESPDSILVPFFCICNSS